MKKILLILTTVLVVVALVPVAAYASEKQEKQVSDFVTKQDKVLAAKTLVYDNNCVVAIKTEKFLNKTEYDQFKENLIKKLSDKFDFEYIIVTRSPKAMHAIEEISKLSSSEREAAVKKFLEMLSSRHPTTPIEPRR